jgi:alpha 1,2-mannosyltransferase
MSLFLGVKRLHYRSGRNENQNRAIVVVCRTTNQEKMPPKIQPSRPPPLSVKKSTLPSSRQDLDSPVTQRRIGLSRGVIRLLLQFGLFGLVFWAGTKVLNRRAEGKVASVIPTTQTVVHRVEKLSNPGKPNVKGCFVMLTRNGDLHSVRATVRQVEDRLNRRFNYPYIFINDQPFTEKFKDFTSALTGGKTFYGEIPPEQWGWPEWVDQQTAQKNMQKMEEQKVLYGGSLSYRHMCRFESGFFFRHPLLDQCDYYWRIEPGVYYYCDMEDPFALMQQQKAKYGFTISLLEYKETIPSLWATVKSFVKDWNANHPNDKLPRDERMYSFITDDEGETYNLCHFWSKYDVPVILQLTAIVLKLVVLLGLGVLNISPTLNISTRLATFITVLCSRGWLIFIERWGDAPVHSIAVGLFLRFEEVIFYNDIGYKHEPFTHCPSDLTKVQYF